MHCSGMNVEANNRMLHPTEEKMIKDNAKRFAKEVYGTDNPTQDQITAATSLLANTAQNLVDNNMGYDVPYSGQAEAFLHTLQSEYAAASPNLSIGNGQYLFYATPEQKSSPYINSGTQDKEIAGVIIKAPIKSPEQVNNNGVKRDVATNLELDDQGRYSQRIVVEGKAFEPKYFPCPVASAGCGGQNLDMSDPQTAAYVKALDKKILNDIGTGATAVVLAAPTGVVGGVAGAVGVAAAITSGMLEDQTLKSFMKEGGQILATHYLKGVYGLSEAVAIRMVSLVDMAGGWQAFADRTQEQIKDNKEQKK